MHSVHMKPNPLDPGEFGVHTEDSAEAEGKSSLSVEGKTHKIIISYPHSTCLAGKEDSSSWNNKKKNQRAHSCHCSMSPAEGSLAQRKVQIWNQRDLSLNPSSGAYWSYYLRRVSQFHQDSFQSAQDQR